jgi:hypothetical protein
MTDLICYLKFYKIIYIVVLVGYSQARAQVPDAGEDSRHAVVFKNEYVRILNGLVPSRDTTRAHTHSANSIVIFLSQSTLGIQNMRQKPIVTKVNPGDVVYRSYGDLPVNHIVWNESADPLHFMVVELLKSPRLDSCTAVSQSELKLELQNKMVRVYRIDVAKDKSLRVPKTNCSYFLMDISGNVITSSLQDKHILNVNDFAFFPPQSDIEIRSVKENSQCVLLELK